MENKTKSSKGLIATTLLLFLVCLGLGGYGFYLNKFAEKEVDVTYKYFVNDEEQMNLPGKTDGYEFSKYKCNNDITGEWNEETWEFTPTAEKSGKCYLYFDDVTYEVSLVLPDGVKVSGSDKVEIKKDEEALFEVALDEGKSIKEINCTNEQKAVFEESQIKLSELTDDTVCTVVTENSKHNVEVKAINGKVTDYKKEVVFGENIIYSVTPENGYSLDTVTCTNNQTGSWSNGKLTVEKVTSDTVCTVSFKASQYTVSVKVVNGKVEGEATKTIDSKGTTTFTITPNSGTNASKISCTNGQKGTFSNNNFTVTKVTANTTCTITFPTE